MNKVIYELVIADIVDTWVDDHTCPDTCNGDEGRICNECFHPDVMPEYTEEYEDDLRKLSYRELQQHEYFNVNTIAAAGVTPADIQGEFAIEERKECVLKESVINPCELRDWLQAPMGVKRISKRHITNL